MYSEVLDVLSGSDGCCNIQDHLPRTGVVELGRLRQEDHLGPGAVGCNVLCLSCVCTRFGISVVAPRKRGTTGCLRRSE